MPIHTVHECTHRLARGRRLILFVLDLASAHISKMRLVAATFAAIVSKRTK